MSCRKLGLNEEILEFAKGGLKNWLGLDVVGCVGYILRLGHERMVCFGMRVEADLTRNQVAKNNGNTGG